MVLGGNQKEARVGRVLFGGYPFWLVLSDWSFGSCVKGLTGSVACFASSFSKGNQKERRHVNNPTKNDTPTYICIYKSHIYKHTIQTALGCHEGLGGKVPFPGLSLVSVADSCANSFFFSSTFGGVCVKGPAPAPEFFFKPSRHKKDAMFGCAEAQLAQGKCFWT